MVAFLFFIYAVRPVSVKIIVGSADAFVAGHNAGLVCRSWGSKPFAQLAWYKNGVHITDQIQYEALSLF